ncbi:MAG: hypothetical protein EBU31_10275 [Proteobacteria bacterium]|nr:hypothetical protein [Pseudomonadota bacterium]
MNAALLQGNAALLHASAGLFQVSDADPESPAGGVSSDGRTGERSEVGMRISPEVVLLVGGTILTIALFAVFVPFLMRVWREDAAVRSAKADRAGADGRSDGRADRADGGEP